MRRWLLGLLALGFVGLFTFSSAVYAQCEPEVKSMLRKEYIYAKRDYRRAYKRLRSAEKTVSKMVSRLYRAAIKLERVEALYSRKLAATDQRCDLLIERLKIKRAYYVEGLAECLLGISIRSCTKFYTLIARTENKIDRYIARCDAKMVKIAASADYKIAKYDLALYRAEENLAFAEAEVPPAAAEYSTAESAYLAAKAAYEACL